MPNSYTVVIADAHSHSATLPPMFPVNTADEGNTISGKLNAAAAAIEALRASSASVLAAFTAGDALTITITQP
jgi:hypothetical protein